MNSGDIGMPEKVREAMQLQVEAERKKRASVLESEGVREAEINIAEGKKRARILTSEAYKMEQVNRASGESNAIQVKAEAQAEAIKRVADALHTEVRSRPLTTESFIAWQHRSLRGVFRTDTTR